MAEGYIYLTLQEDLAADMAAIHHMVGEASEPLEVLDWGIGVHTTAITAADTNYTTFKLTNGATTIGTLVNGPVSGGTSIAVGTIAKGSVTAANAHLASGAQLCVEGTKTGNGLAIAGATVWVKLRRTRV